MTFSYLTITQHENVEINMLHYYGLILKLHIHFNDYINNVLPKASNSELYIVFACQVSSVSFTFEQFLNFSFIFLTLTVHGLQNRYFVECHLI